MGSVSEMDRAMAWVLGSGWGFSGSIRPMVTMQMMASRARVDFRARDALSVVVARGAVVWVPERASFPRVAVRVGGMVSALAWRRRAGSREMQGGGRKRGKKEERRGGEGGES